MGAAPEDPDVPAQILQPVTRAVHTSPAATDVQSTSRFATLTRLIRAVAEVDGAAIESAARQLGESRRILAPVAWVAGTLVLLLRGVKLLILNWRLSLIQLVPAIWVWLAMWDLKQHLFHGASFRHPPFWVLLAAGAAVVLLTMVALWCNAVFAFAIDGPPPPRILPAIRQARQRHPLIGTSGFLVGCALAVAVVLVPRIAGVWLYSLVLGLVLAGMLISFVAIPARIIGVRPQKLPPKEALGRALAGGTLSAVAMGPGFLLDRIGLILLGLHHFHVIGFVLLSIGTALYAAGMSSVKVVKMSMKLATPDVATAS
jgi:hypothetical protein